MSSGPLLALALEPDKKKRPASLAVDHCPLCKAPTLQQLELGTLKKLAQSDFLTVVPLESQASLLWAHFMERVGFRNPGDAGRYHPALVFDHLTFHMAPLRVTRDQVERECQAFYAKFRPKRSTWTGPMQPWRGHLIPARCVIDQGVLARRHPHPLNECCVVDPDDHLYYVDWKGTLTIMDVSVTEWIQTYFETFQARTMCMRMLQGIQRTKDPFPTRPQDGRYRTMPIWCRLVVQDDGSLVTQPLDAWEEGAEYRNVEDAVTYITAQWAAEGEAASRRGRLVHAWVEHYLNGDEVDLKEPCLQQFVTLHHELEAKGYEIYRTEFNVFDPVVGLGGAVDAIYVLKGHAQDAVVPVLIVDLKHIPYDTILEETHPTHAQEHLFTLGQRKYDKQTTQLNTYQFITERLYQFKCLGGLYVASIHSLQQDAVLVPLTDQQTLLQTMYQRFLFYATWRAYVASQYQS